MKKILKFLVVVFFISLFVSPQTFALTTDPDYSRGPVLASVGVHDIDIVQNNNNFDITFSISNGQGVQSGVKYGVKLIKETEKGQVVVDEKTYNESLTLSENSIIEKKINYIAPLNLSGEYSILIVTQNESGLMFGLAFAGQVEIFSSIKGLDILPETCFVSIEGDILKKKYDLIQGVDISQQENLILKCSVINNTDKSVTASPSFETHHRTIYGEVVPQSEVNNELIIFNQGEKKNVTVILPKALKPQAYDVKFDLDYGSEKSNSVIVHYVLQGASATIQNLSLDKDYYEKGETAKLFFSWFPSADSFPGSRQGEGSAIPEVFMVGKITNKMGLTCAEPLNQPLSTEHNTMKNEIDVPITRNCFDPELSLSIVDSDGNVLDQKTFKIETTSKKQSLNLVLVIILLAIILIVVLFYLRKKKIVYPNNTSMGVLVILIIFSVSLLVIPNLKVNAIAIDTERHALLIAVNGGGGGGGGTSNPADTGTPPAGLNATINLDKTAYSPEENIIVTSSVYYNACSNTARHIIVTGYITNNSDYTSSTKTLYNGTIKGGLTPVYSIATFTAPSVPGNYVLKVKIDGYVPASYSAYDDNNAVSITETNFMNFRYALMDYIQETYSNHPYISDVMDILYNSSNLYQLQEISDHINSMYISGTEGYLDFTRNYELPFTVIAGPTVTIKANDSTDPPPVIKGSNVEITWTSTNATSCSCSYSNNGAKTSCGTGTYKTIPYIHNSVDKLTTYTVICSN